MRFADALETSCFLAEKVASARTPATEALREKQAIADFATFGLFKQAAIDPQSLARGLGWGVGLGVPALGVGHMLMRDARSQGEHLIENARNQALMTAAGVGGMQALGELLKQHGASRAARAAQPPAAAPYMMPAPVPEPAAAPMPMLSDEQKLAAAILVDDILERACDHGDEQTKRAALAALVVHRHESTELLRSMLP